MGVVRSVVAGVGGGMKGTKGKGGGYFDIRPNL